jgi:hypothetical protein
MPESSTAAEPADKPPLPDAARLQILATEHWSLLANRSLIWSETFSRAGMLLTSLSAAVVSLALVAQVARFGDSFSIMALLVLPVVLLVGIGTFVRLGDARGEDIYLVMGMNRLRHGYMDIAPDMEQYFVTSQYDDWNSVLSSYSPTYKVGLGRLVASTPFLVGVINSALVGIIFSVALEYLDTEGEVHVTAGVIAALVAATLFLGAAPYREIGSLRRLYQPRFPRRTDD